MNKRSLRIGAIVLTALGLIGLISEVGPTWSHDTLVIGGIVVYLLSNLLPKK